jgi:hypothetical protein
LGHRLPDNLNILFAERRFQLFRQIFDASRFNGMRLLEIFLNPPALRHKLFGSVEHGVSV